MSIVNKFLSEMPKIKKNSEELIEKVKIKSKKISDITKKANDYNSRYMNHSHCITQIFDTCCSNQ